MKKHILLVMGIVLGLLVFDDADAQKKKKKKKKKKGGDTEMVDELSDELEEPEMDIKAWKKKAKEYVKNPAGLKQLVEDNETLGSQVSSLKSKNNSLQSQLSDSDAKVTDLQDDMAKLRRDLASAREAAEKAAEEEAASPRRSSSMKGVVFKVQIGAFRNKDLSKYFENHENFTGETDEDGTQKITLGQFADYWEADTFKKYLREMGVKDAWIVPYKDGVRVPIKDVLEGVMTSGSDS